MKPWQHGYQLEQLKPLATLFSAQYRPYVYGAFGMPKERDVAAALAEDRCAYARTEPGGDYPIAAIALFNVLKSGSTHTDFALRELRLSAGELFVQHFAVRSLDDLHDRGGRLLTRLAERAGASVTWLELHREHAELYEWAREEGFAPMLTKVMASSDLRVVMGRGPAELLEARRPAPLAPHDLLSMGEIAPDFLSADELSAIDAELRVYEAGRSAWAQHYSSYNKRQSWTAFCIRGYDPADPFFIMKPAEMAKAWKEEHPALLAAGCSWTVAEPAFPAARAVVDRIPGEKDRVRFMRLAPGGGELTRHADITDRDAGTRDGKIARLHLPIRSNPQVEFAVWDAEGVRRARQPATRGLYYLDQRKPHTVKNGHPSLERVHLVVDVRCTPELRSWLDRATEAEPRLGA